MARLPRLVLPGQTHLVVHRARDGAIAFADDEDCQAYVAALDFAARNCRVAVHAYGLRPEEVRLLLTPSDADGLAAMMRGIGVRYVHGLNQRRSSRGTPWEGRFRSALVEAATMLKACTLFVEDGAGGHGSLAHHLGRRSDPLITEHPVYWASGNTPFERQAEHQRAVTAGQDAQDVARFEVALGQGRPVGSPAYLDGLAAVTEHRVRARPRGRPRADISPSPIKTDGPS